jgi:PAS domain S-box-containing protein
MKIQNTEKTDPAAPEYLTTLYKRHFQGALVRSGASFAMWMFALAAFMSGTIRTIHFTGMTLAVIYLIAINPPTLFLLKRIKSISFYKYASLLINFLEIVGYTAIIYFRGGWEASFLTPIYAALITYVGVMAPWNFPFIIAGLCSAAFGCIIAFELTGFLPPPKVVATFTPPPMAVLIDSFVVIALLFVVAFISSLTGGLLRRQRKKLRRQNLDLIDKTAALEKMQKRLSNSHEELEKRVLKRTAALREINEKLRQEISERKQVEQSLKINEEKYRALFENVNELVYTLDTEMRVTSVTPSVERLFGYTPEEITGKNITELKILPPEYYEQAFLNIARVFDGEIITSYIYEFATKDGKSRKVDVSGAPIFHEGKIMGLTSVARDITDQLKNEEEKEKLKEQLQRAQKMEAIGTLAGGVAHDLNNVLSGIVSYPDLILMQLPLESPLRKPLATIRKSGEMAAAIVTDLLTLARRGVVTKQVIHLNDVLMEHLKSPEFETLKSYHPNLKVKVRVAKDLLKIEGSPVHLSKTIMNLVSNAAEAMPKGGTVIITTENRHVDSPIVGYDHVKKGDYVALSVSDTGTGISAEDRNRIFEPFYTTKVMGRSGTGLGMSVVWGTVKDHDGYIDIRSEEEKGTVFTLYFPATREKVSAAESASAIDTFKGKGESILVIDDMEGQREIASALLTQLGYSVNTVASGEEAVAHLKDTPVDLLILDMVMPPGMDGLDTYKKILKIHPGQKAIIASGLSETERVREAQRLGAGQYVKKPYTIEKIGRAVGMVLNR